MKHHTTDIFRIGCSFVRRALVAVVCCVIAFAAYAQYEETDKEPDELAVPFSENINTPVIPPKHKAKVIEYMAELSRTLAAKGYAVDLRRDGEVLEVTISCDLLFAPNSTELTGKGVGQLAYLKRHIGSDKPYKVILAVHADDTGDELYSDRLTADRANAIDSYFFEAFDGVETGIIPYGIGQDEPLNANNSMASRSRNRRVEIYFVPRQELYQKMKK